MYLFQGTPLGPLSRRVFHRQCQCLRAAKVIVRPRQQQDMNNSHLAHFGNIASFVMKLLYYTIKSRRNLPSASDVKTPEIKIKSVRNVITYLNRRLVRLDFADIIELRHPRTRLRIPYQYSFMTFCQHLSYWIRTYLDIPLDDLHFGDTYTPGTIHQH